MMKPDADIENADWMKGKWNLPPYKSEEFMKMISDRGMTLNDFRKRNRYQLGIGLGLIENDEWVGDRNESGDSSYETDK